MIIHSDKEFSDDKLESSNSSTHEEEGVSGTIVMDAKEKSAIQHNAYYREFLADEIPVMHQRSALQAFWSEILEMFGVHKYDSEYNLDDTSESMEPSEEERNTDAEKFKEEGSVCNLEGNYPLGKEVAHGGQGIISTAKDIQFGRTVAIKSLKVPKNQEARNAFFTEARITAHLEHPAIVPIHTLYLDSENAPHLAMKMIEGKSFRKRLTEVKRKYASLPWYKICAVERWQRKLRIERFLRVCEALEFAHARNVLHRDLKPENIMVGRFGEVYVMDWGMAQVMPQGQDWVVSGICGTPRYISPEVLQHRPYGKTADIYQLGLILYETVFLRRAFPWKNRDQVLERVKKGELAPLQHYYGCHVSRTLCRIISRATSLSPRDRYQQVSELARDLRGYLKNESTSVERYPRLADFMRVVSRNSQALLALLLLICLLATALVLVTMRNNTLARQAQKQEDDTLKHLYSSSLNTTMMMEKEIEDVEEGVLALSRETSVRLTMLQEPNRNLDYYRGTTDVFNGEKRHLEAPPGYGYVPTFDNDVSFRAFFWHLPDNAPLENVDSILTTLFPMMPTFKRLLTDHFRPGTLGEGRGRPVRDLSVERTPVLNSRVAFDNKLMLAYPYEGDMPPSYDVTKSVWFQAGKKLKREECVWTHPFISVRVLDRIIIGCAAPIFEEDGREDGVAVAILAPGDLVALYAAKLSNAKYIRAHYLVHENGDVYATDQGRLAPKVKNGEIVFSQFPHYDKFMEMRHLNMGRTFLNDETKETLFIFNRISRMKCIYIEEIDFKMALKTNWENEELGDVPEHRSLPAEEMAENDLQ